ncbi:amidase signature enzyme [Cutaneotrichosporon oleaginosum]|uniref:Glutamyl-tRNA(Gln) amidotransferase subunit A, mitochondrial n=1 Tax=Cutaneotrichosporon oleaginosum TaxID=879819 RepID=A0A0J0XSK2_9TREE|nr:amidase signature enzyme [Cutaneotrichosporon oleaginosum]KLT44048.1 amidase signature enzyme [Cutaneotrichosporon oleaginosum]TXT09494.1 hypothetical protein COLE_03428 [Cutaneotrichosporon oleaginosum]
MRSSLRLAQGAKQAASFSAQGAEVHATPGPYVWRSAATPGPSSGRLSGRSIAVKDNISYAGAPTTCSSRILEGYMPPYTATCVQRLIDEGAHIVGKTKMDEFGMGSENTHMPKGWGPVPNPSGPPGEPRSVGGSSGGSAAAVADGSAWAALGTDTGGSVRLPASFCGVVGLKPSYGMISRYGVVSYADSLDCVGVLGSTIDVVEEVFGVLSVPDERDMTCATAATRERAASIAAAAPSSMQGLRIGLPVQTHVQGAYQLPPALLEHLKSQGAELVPVDIPALRLSLPAYYVLATAEAASNLGRFGGSWWGSAWERARDDESGTERRRRIRSEGFGYEVRKRIMAGTHTLTADAFNNSYLKALALRHDLKQQYSDVFALAHPLRGEGRQGGVHVLLHPTAIGPAPRLHDDGSGDDARYEYLQDVLTASANLAGLPAMSVPASRVDGWPVGVSIVGQWGTEDVVFRAGRGVEAWVQASASS